MAQCGAINNAMAAKGYTNAQLAAQSGLSAQRVDAILAGSTKPSQQEFSSIAKALGLDANTTHASSVTA